MFNTGRRSIFDVCRPHTGHRIEMLEIQEEGVVKGIKVYCRTCSTVLLQQETQDYDIRNEIATRKSRRLNAMSFDQWESNFFSGVNLDCECDDCEDCMVRDYEGSELNQFYEEYLDSLTPPVVSSPEPWDTGETVTPQPSPQGRNWEESRPVVPPSTGWEQVDTGWTTE